MMSVENRQELCLPCQEQDYCGVANYLHVMMLATSNQAGRKLDPQEEGEVLAILADNGLTARTFATSTEVQRLLDIDDILAAADIARQLNCTIFPYLSI